MALRCLIVDDNAHFLEAASGMLGAEGATVIGVATTGAEALQRAGELRPDVALVDIDLGEESGLDLAWQLAEAEGTEPSHVILISACAGEDFAELVTASPAAGFLSKADLSVNAVRDVLETVGNGAESRRSPGRGTGLLRAGAARPGATAAASSASIRPWWGSVSSSGPTRSSSSSGHWRRWTWPAP